MLDKLLRRVLAVALLAGVAPSLFADDWPNWRGPNHNGLSAETDWLAKWPADGPHQLWHASLGVGFSSVAVSQGRVYTMGNKSDTETVFCFDAETGKVVWKYSYKCPTGPLFYEGGPSATPTIESGHVYTLSRRGDVFCLNAADGKVVWNKNVAKELSLEIPQWGFASSALIEGNSLLLNVGTYGAAFDKNTGATLWSSGQEKSGYSTPVPYPVGGKTALAMMTATGTAGVDLATGKKLWEYLWKTDYDINAPDPIFHDEKFFVSSTYGKFDGVLDVQNGEAKPVWHNDHLLIQLNSAVLVDGYLYGIAGIAGPSASATMRCIDWQTGSVKWSFPEVGGGALMVADGKIIALGDKGELFVGAASPQGFTPISRAQVLGGRCWTVPVLANGHIYCRNARGDLVCLDVKGK